MTGHLTFKHNTNLAVSERQYRIPGRLVEVDTELSLSNVKLVQTLIEFLVDRWWWMLDSHCKLSRSVSLSSHFQTYERPSLEGFEATMTIPAIMAHKTDQPHELHSSMKDLKGVLAALSTSMGECGANSLLSPSMELSRSPIACGKRERDVKLTCPALSLKHEKHPEQQQPAADEKFSDRKQAEEHAVTLLGRSLSTMVFGRDGNAGESILRNVFSSLSVLVDSRLRAYVAFLARHALSMHSSSSEKDQPAAIGGIEEKLQMILQTGKDIVAESLSASFKPTSDITTDDDTLDDSSSSNLRIVFSFEITMLRPNGTKETIPIEFCANGAIRGIFTPKPRTLDAVEVTLDVNDLLAKMVRQAARVVSAVVEIASNACNNSKHQISRSASFLAMPPPPTQLSSNKQVRPHSFASLLKRKNHPKQGGLDLLCQAACDAPVVSPELSGLRVPFEVAPCFELEAAEDEDVSNLSFDQCADIVDTCLLGEPTTNESPLKRMRIE